MIKLSKLIKDFKNNKYSKDNKSLSIESKNIVNESFEEIYKLLDNLDKYITDDAQLTLTIFLSAFILGRYYERSVNDSKLYKRTSR